MRRIFVVMTGLALAVGPASAEEIGTSSVFTVDPSGPRRSDRDIILRTTPYIAIYDVLPQFQSCEGSRCGPSASFFIENPGGGGKSVTVTCSAIDRGQQVIATGSETVGMPPNHAGISLVLFPHADFTRFASVECHISGIVEDDSIK